MDFSVPSKMPHPYHDKSRNFPQVKHSLSHGLHLQFSGLFTGFVLFVEAPPPFSMIGP